MTAVEILTALINISSVSGHEKQVLDYIVANFVNKWQKVGNNLVLKIAGKDKSRGVIFNAHVDTVGEGEKSAWRHSPLEGKVVGNKLFGLGASDEKATVAVLLMLAKKWGQVKPVCDVWLTLVSGEEIDGRGTQEVVERYKKVWKKYKKVAVVLGEPTGLRKVLVGHKGNAFIIIVVKGDSGHGAMPGLVKKKAIEQAWKVWQKLENYNWQKKFADPTLGVPTVALTGIKAGITGSPNKIADTCELIVDVRTTPKLEGKVVRLVERLTKVEVKPIFEEVRCGYLPENLHLAEIVSLPVAVAEYACDLVFFTQVGIPGIIIGPGEMEVIHKPNEYCEVDKLDKCLDIYSRIVREFAKL